MLGETEEEGHEEYWTGYYNITAECYICTRNILFQNFCALSLHYQMRSTLE
jgi:hypothetical protein